MELTELPTTESGTVRKQDAMAWFRSLTPENYADDSPHLSDVADLDPDARGLITSVTAKPDGFEGSTFPAPISTVRLTGTPEFITEAARRFAPLLVFESEVTYLSVKLQRVEDRDTGELTDNWALYLNASERGGQAKAARSILGESG